MKFEQSIKYAMALAGLGVCLFFANSSYAQSEVAPDIFDVSPTATEVGVSGIRAEDGAYSVASGAQAASAEQSELPLAAEAVGAEGLSSLDAGIVMAIAGCLMVFGAYAMTLGTLTLKKKNSSMSQAAMPRAAA